MNSARRKASTASNQRFLQRFAKVEAALGGDLSGRSIEELEGLWQQAKAELRSEQGWTAPEAISK